MLAVRSQLPKSASRISTVCDTCLCEESGMHVFIVAGFVAHNWKLSPSQVENKLSLKKPPLALAHCTRARWSTQIESKIRD